MKGIFLVKPHGELIANKTKTLILKKKPIPKDYLNIPILVVDNEHVWAKIILRNPKIIGLKQFNNLKNKHQISDKEREKWWKDTKKFYAYDFDLLETYKNLYHLYKKGTQTVVKDVEIL